MSSISDKSKKRLSVLSNVSAAPTSVAAGDTSKPTYWKSLAELEQSPEFLELAAREFAAPLEQEPPNSPGRRRFMQIMGASMSLAGLDACRWREDKILPLSRRPEGTIPGSSRYFATAMEINGNAVGLYAASYDGRPIKIEGNPAHPDSLGAAAAFHQATVLGLYDPDRSTSVVSGAGAARKESSRAVCTRAEEPDCGCSPNAAPRPAWPNKSDDYWPPSRRPSGSPSSRARSTERARAACSPSARRI